MQSSTTALLTPSSLFASSHAVNICTMDISAVHLQQMVHVLGGLLIRVDGEKVEMSNNVCIDRRGCYSMNMYSCHAKVL